MGLPSHQGSVLLFDGETLHPFGRCWMAVPSPEVRTRCRQCRLPPICWPAPDAEVLALIGSGAQARSHLLAIREIRRLREVRVWSPSLESDTRFAGKWGR